MDGYRINRSTMFRCVLGAALMCACGAGLAASAHYSLVGSLPASQPGGLTTVNTIVLGADGKIYGSAGTDTVTDERGGLFSMSTAGSFEKLYGFKSEDGWSFDPDIGQNFNKLVQMPDGSLFGINGNGGSYANYSPAGTAFSLSSGGTFTVVHTFATQLGDAMFPKTIALGADGNIYGLTEQPPFGPGGPQIGGSLFKLSPDGQETLLFSLSGLSDSLGSFLLGASGDMYVSLPEGTIPPGGSSELPAQGIYKVSQSGEGTLLHAFNADYSDGRRVSDLVMNTAGDIVGSSELGGVGEFAGGTVFKLDADGHFAVLHAFSYYSNGEYSPSDLMAGADGSVYGVAEFGGGLYSDGALFRIAPNGRYSLLHLMGDDYALEGSRPRGLIQGGPRTIYGIVGGGANGTGAIFKLVVPIQDDLTGSGVSSLVLNGSGILSTGTATGSATQQSITAGYFPVAMGDFNGDGIADILWTSSRRDLYIWLGGTGGFTAKYAGTYPAGWKVVGAGDFDGDGMEDLAWTNASTSQFSYWLMNGAVRKGYKIVKYTAGYFPATVGDYDGDGRADVLWSSAKHDLYAWLSRGQGFRSYFVARFPAAWKITGRGDLDGDGKADLVWSTSDGTQWGYWLMDGGSIRSTKSFAVPAAVSGAHVAAVADYDGDGVADVLWSDGHALTLWENRGGCLDEPGCAFSQSVPSMSLSTGQAVFNSGLPVTN